MSLWELFSPFLPNLQVAALEGLLFNLTASLKRKQPSLGISPNTPVPLDPNLNMLSVCPTGMLSYEKFWPCSVTLEAKPWQSTLPPISKSVLLGSGVALDSEAFIS